MKHLIRWHRGLALGVACVCMLWMLSGLLHPILSRMGPDLTPVDHWVDSTEPAVQASLALIDDRIAQYPVAVTRVNAFSDEYQAFQKVLPVWRVAFEDPAHTRVMVAVNSGRVMSATNENKLTATALFKALHTWSVPILGGAEIPQTMTTTLKTIAIVAVDLSLMAGLGLLIMRRYKGLPSGRNRLRMWHRRLGLVVITPFLAFSLSGTLHLYKNELPTHLRPTEQWVFNTLHKWRFADSLGKTTRDLLQASAVLACGAVVLIGLQQRKRQQLYPQ